MSWLLVGSGKLRQFFTHESWQSALESAAVWVNPALLTILVCTISFGLYRRIGPVPASLFAAYIVTLGDVDWEFQALRPDHQSLQALLGMLMLAGIAFAGAGWIRIGENKREPHEMDPLEVPTWKIARKWLLLSGICAGLSLWVSAVVALTLLLMILGAGIFLSFCAPDIRADSDVTVKPEVWLLWGCSAGIVSLLFYLVEYGGAFPGLRLEVNGPIYSLAVVGIGEAIRRFLMFRYTTGNDRTRHLLAGCLLAAAVGLVPFAILFGPPGWHALRDPEMFRLHNFIQEFYSLPRFAGDRLWKLVFGNFGILPLFLLLAAGLAAFCKLRTNEWAVMWLSFAVGFGLLALGYFQVRWLGLFAAINVWIGVVTGVFAWSALRSHLGARSRLILSICLPIVLLIQPVVFGVRQHNPIGRILQQRALPPELSAPVLNKRLALAFRDLEGPGARVMADPDFAPALHYFADAAGVVSFYWENIEGLHAATKFFADAPNGEQAKLVAERRHITHVIVPEGNRLQNYFYFIANNKFDQIAARQTFVAQLVGSEFTLPEWLQTTPALQSIGFQIYTYGGTTFEERWRIYKTPFSR